MNESLHKRRQVSLALAAPDGVAGAEASEVGSEDDADETIVMSDDMWNALLSAFERSDTDEILVGVTLLRHALNCDAPPIDDVVSRNIVPLLARCLQVTNNDQLLLESAWALTNVAAADTRATYAVVEAGVIPLCVQLISADHVSDALRDLCIWVIGNVAGEDAACRQHCFASNVHRALVEQLSSETAVAIMRSSAWALSNLCRGLPSPDFAVIGPCLQPMAQLLQHDDRGIVIETLWAFLYLLDNCDDALRQAIVDCGVCTTLARLVGHLDSAVCSAALRCTGSIMSGTAEQTEAMVRAGPFPSLLKLLNEKRLLTEVCWLLSNVTAGEPSQIQAVIDEGILTKMPELMFTGDFSVRRESTWVVCNAIVGATNDQMCEIVDEEVVEALLAVAHIDDAEVVVLALDSINKILVVSGEGQEYMMEWFEELGGLQLLNDLVGHPDENVFTRVDQILVRFYDCGDDGEDDSENE